MVTNFFFLPTVGLACTRNMFFVNKFSLKREVLKQLFNNYISLTRLKKTQSELPGKSCKSCQLIN